MFNLDNFDLDFEDDFPSTVFNKFSQSEGKSKKEFHNKFPSNNQSVVDFDVSSTLSEIQTTQKSNQQIVEPKKSNFVFDFSSSKSFTDQRNKLKRPCEQDNKPFKKKLTREGLVQRKFPGPAGILPDKPVDNDLSFFEKKTSENEPNERRREEPVVFSQSSGSVFSESAYQKLVRDFELNDPHNPLNKYSIEWVKKTAINKSLHGRKIPFLAVTLHCINNNSLDPILILRDVSGEISGTLHREVWTNMAGKLRSGIAIALRQVGVLISGIIRRKIYLNITMNNILAIYSKTENDGEVEVFSVNRTTKSDLLKSAERWQPCPSPKPPEKPQTSLFSTVSSGKNRHNSEQMKNIKNMSEKEKKQVPDESLEDLSMSFSESDFCEDISVPENDVSFDLIEGKREENKTCFQQEALSQADSLIMEEVLSGINLDEFEL